MVVLKVLSAKVNKLFSLIERILKYILTEARPGVINMDNNCDRTAGFRDTISDN